MLWFLIGTALVSAHPVPFFIIIFLMTMAGLWEFFQLLHLRQAQGEAVVTMATSAVYISVCFWTAAAGGGIDFSDLISWPFFTSPWPVLSSTCFPR